MYETFFKVEDIVGSGSEAPLDVKALVKPTLVQSRPPNTCFFNQILINITVGKVQF